MVKSERTPEEFERACSLLPEGTMWGEYLSVEIVSHIDQASRRAALEDAAKVCDRMVSVSAVSYETGSACGRAIRALASGDTK